MKNWLKWLLKGLAVLGGLVALAILWRSKKSSDANQTKFLDNVQAEVKNVIHLPMWLMILLSNLAMLWCVGHGMEGEGVAMAWLWASIPASSTATVNFTYIPQFISFTISSAPTAVQINVQGDGLTFNLDATGVTNMNGVRQLGAVTNKYLFQIADGLINGKNGSITVTNAAAAVLNIEGYSMDPGTMYFTHLTQNALANSGFILDNFAYAAFPSAAATDLFVLEYRNGITQNSYRDDLNSMLFYKQNTLASRYNFDNIAPSTIKRITFTPAATQNFYVMKYQSSSGTVNSAVNS